MKAIKLATRHSPALILAAVSTLGMAGCMMEDLPDPGTLPSGEQPHAVSASDVFAASWSGPTGPAAASLSMIGREDVAALAPSHVAFVLPPNLTLRVVPADYDGDGRVDISVLDNNGAWYVDYAANGFGSWDVIRLGYGGPNCVAVPADYDGDHKADYSIKCPETNPDGSVGTWLIDYAASPQDGWNVIRTGYGNAGGHPVPADYDGDGKADLSIKGDDGAWLVDYASSPQDGWNLFRGGYGNATCLPVPADYDGDHKADFSIKCPATNPDGTIGTWYVDYASTPLDGFNVIRGGYGNATAHPVPADYDGDGRADYSVKADDGTWFVDHASSPQTGWDLIVTGYGNSSFIPLPGDYDGDGRADLATISTLSVRSSPRWSIDHATNGFGAIDLSVFLQF